MEPLDNILSRGGETAPQPDVKETPQLDVSQPAPEQNAAQTQEPEAPETEVNGQRMVPKAALDDARGKVKRYTEQVADFQRQLKEDREASERRMAELMQRIPQQQPQEQRQPDWYENPNDAAISAVAPYLTQLQQAQMHNSRLIATSVHTAERVDQAEQAFMNAVQSRQVDPADYQKVVGSPNRYAAAVEWHKRQSALAEIGDDPAAYRAKVEAELLAKYGMSPDGQGGAQPPVQQQQRTMPSSFAAARNVGARGGPTWGGPTALGDIFNRQPAKR